MFSSIEGPRLPKPELFTWSSSMTIGRPGPHWLPHSPSMPTEGPTQCWSLSLTAACTSGVTGSLCATLFLLDLLGRLFLWLRPLCRLGNSFRAQGAARETEASCWVIEFITHTRKFGSKTIRLPLPLICSCRPTCSQIFAPSASFVLY